MICVIEKGALEDLLRDSEMQMLQQQMDRAGLYIPLPSIDFICLGSNVNPASRFVMG
jgi:hypothetical protein